MRTQTTKEDIANLEKIINVVGYEEASMWGASMLTYEFVGTDNPVNPIVRFYAIEHGERFYFDLTLTEVIECYHSYCH